MGYAQVRVHIWCHVAASQAPTHSRGMRPPPPQARPLLQQTATRHPRNSPPSQAFRLSKGGGGATGLPTTHGTTRQGTTGGVGKGNPQHREPHGPFPFPFPSQMRRMAMMLCTMTSMCYSQCGCWWYLCSYVTLSFGTACSLLYLFENRAWLVMFLRKLY